LPDIGDEFKKEEEMVVIESVKSVSDVEAPVDGTIEDVNESLEGEPEKINESPTEDGWLVKIDMKDEDQFGSLLDSSEYDELLD